jgi:glutamate N-acetyltransferase/amino-acid N-acetyltransferase
MINKFISPFIPKKIIDVRPSTFKIYTFNAGYKKFKHDLLIVVFEQPVKISAVFTRSSTPSAPVIWGKTQNKNNLCKILIVNSGNANAFTGNEGIQTIKKYASFASKLFNCKLKQVFVSSTGIIGEKLDPNLIISKLKLIKNSKPKSLIQAAKAIMTTDTYPKVALETIMIKRKKIRIFGIAKGSGMIAPNMGTMLSYIFIEAPLSNIELNKALESNIDYSFNSISVDGDTSTSDTVMIFATQENKLINSLNRSIFFKSISLALKKVMTNLAKQIVCDGEGISKLIEVNVNNAANKKQASKIAFSIAESLLVRTAVYGNDTNWGRIIAAIGKTFEKIDQSKFILKFGNYLVGKNGKASKNLNERKLKTYIKNKIIKINLDLKLGKYNKTVWSSDLTKKYVEINADYRT